VFIKYNIIISDTNSDEEEMIFTLALLLEAEEK
jgi:hypothetical protein